MSCRGNIIDLGNYQREVAESCSGFVTCALMTMPSIIRLPVPRTGLEAPVIFLSVQQPITIVMNSLRIGFHCNHCRTPGANRHCRRRLRFRGLAGILLHWGACCFPPLGSRGRWFALRGGTLSPLETVPAKAGAPRSRLRSVEPYRSPFLAASLLLFAGAVLGGGHAGSPYYTASESDV